MRPESSLDEPVAGQMALDDPYVPTRGFAGMPCAWGASCPHAMHSRCTHCGREQYAMAVWSVSHGIEPCVWCNNYNKIQLLGR